MRSTVPVSVELESAEDRLELADRHGPLDPEDREDVGLDGREVEPP